MKSANFKDELFDPSKRQNYDEMCALISSLVSDENTKNQIIQILKNGYIDNYTPCSFRGKDNDYFEFDRRVATAMLMVTNKETFDFIKENDIVYFHGTNANALPGIKTAGLRPLSNILESGQTVNTGETWSRINGQRSFISFTDVLDLATQYSALKPSSDKENNKELDFPVVVGLTDQNVLSSEMIPVHSDRQEVGVVRDIPLDRINVIMVPSDKVDIIRKMFGESVMVLPYDIKADDRFCYLDGDKIFINQERFEGFKKSLGKRQNSINSLLDIVKNRKATGIMDMINKLKGAFGKDDVIHDESGPSR